MAKVVVVMGDDATGFSQEMTVLSTYTVKGVLYIDVQAPPEEPLCACKKAEVDQMVQEFVDHLSC